MKIHKEKEIRYPLYLAELDNGVSLLVFDGYAEGSDGKVYKPVIEEIYDEIAVIGWCRAEHF